ncbi:MAG: UbiA family prenyltransferase [Thermoplasmata archaeon]|nr:UbiA family prenyltransferase [Thermoplasmata archaeon]
MHPVLKLVRLGNVLVSFAGTVVGGLAARGGGVALGGEFLALLVLAGVSTACVTAGGNTLNDLLDLEGDRTNHPDRPLVTGAVGIGGARRLVIGLFVAAGLLIIPVALSAPLVLLILGIALAVLLSYEFRLKAAGWLGNLEVAFLTGAVFLYGGAVAHAPLSVVPFAVMAIAATLSREVIKDMEDAEGDLGRRTLPRMRGMAFSAVIARLGVVAAILLSPIPFATFLSLGSAAGIMYLVLVCAADALFVVSVAYLPARLHFEQSASKGAMTVALVAFLATAFRG